MPQLLYICQPGTVLAGPAAPNIGTAAALQDVFVEG